MMDVVNRSVTLGKTFDESGCFRLQTRDGDFLK